MSNFDGQKGSDDAPWLAFYTRPRMEKKSYELLERKGVTAYLPMRKVVRQWSDRRKKVTVPLITSYVFVKIPIAYIQEVLFTEGILQVVKQEKQPAVIPEREIDAMRQFTGELEFLPEDQWHYFKLGEELEIKHGGLKGNKGELIYQQGQEMVLQLNALGQMIKVSVKASHVEKAKRDE